MPPVVADPNRLTKEQLRRELSENGVDLPPANAKKTVYVELYRQHVLQSSYDSIGFSSDEDDISGSIRSTKKSSSPKKSSAKGKSHNMAEIDVYSLSDDELRQQLELHNVECGPVIASTRRVYEKKLLKVLSGEDTPEPSRTTDFVDYSDDYDEEPAEDEASDSEPVVRETRHTERVVADTRYKEPMIRESKITERSEAIRHRVMSEPEPSWKSASTKLSRDDIHSSSYSHASRYTTSATSRTSAKSVLTQVRQSQAHPAADKQKKKGLSIWIQLIIVIIIALIIFMVFQNMEPANKIPTRSIDQSP